MLIDCALLLSLNSAQREYFEMRSKNQNLIVWTVIEEGVVLLSSCGLNPHQRSAWIRFQSWEF